MNPQLRFDPTFLFSDAVGDSGLDRGAVDALRPACQRALANVAALHASGEIGFPDLPGRIDAAEAAETVAARVREMCDEFVLIGIGGSSLGPVALFNALAHPWHNLLPPDRRGAPRFHVVDNIDPDALDALLETLDPARTVLNIVTKSGSTPESVASFLVLLEWLEAGIGAEEASRRVIATTDPEKGDLRALARSQGWASFAIPPNVGGRWSVLSPVGLFPAAVLGLDVRGLLAGARAAARGCRSADPWENPALLGAVVNFLADTTRGLQTQVFMPYSQKLARAADWFQQLWAESLGKRLRRDGREDPAGQLPVSALGATDQHSVMQLFMEGPVNRVVTFVAVDRFETAAPIPSRFPDRDSFSYLAGHTVEELMAAECRAAQVALARAGRPNAVLSLGRVDARHLGAFFYTLELQTAFAGELYDVNAFDQPGVEAGKKYAAGLLGRPGFEEYARRVGSTSTQRTVSARIDLDPDAEDILADLRAHGALLDGHFVLRSGLHSNRYFQCALALEDPRFAERVGQALAARFRADRIDAVVSPALGGIVPGHEVARALGARSLFAEKNDAGCLEVRRFTLRPGERVLVVEDVVTRGGRVTETLEAVRAAGAEPVGVAVILDRSGGEARFDVRTESLARVEAEVHQPDACPMCRNGDTPVKPGSR